MGEKVWNSGETIVLQDVWQRRVWNAKPMIVAEDTGDFIAAWMPRGTVWQIAITPPTRPKPADRGERIARCMIHNDWLLEEREWQFSTLWLMEKEWLFAVWISWLEDGSRFGGWYINIQEPLRRVGDKLQTMDLTLDVVIELDGTWRWKDEDELETLVRLNAIDDQKASEIRDAGKVAIELMESNQPPFDQPWADWKPDPNWQQPVLPEGWDVQSTE